MSKFWSGGDSSSSSSEDDDAGITEDYQGNEETGFEFGEVEGGLSEDPDAAWEKIRDEQNFLEPVKASNKQLPLCTRIVCISDTHGKHQEICLPKGDILLHGGDFTKSGEIGSIESLSCFFKESGFKEIVCIAGNHDMTLHAEYYERSHDRFHREKFDCEKAQEALQNCTYLLDSSCTSSSGIEIYGSPWSPEFFDWAFNLPRGEPILEIWRKIPSSTDVLITHGPPLGRGDYTTHDTYAGCYDLLNEVQERIKPRVHMFGHVHEGAGVSFDGEVLYVNASNLNLKYQAVNYPVVIDLPQDESKPAMIVEPDCRIEATDLASWCRDNGHSYMSNLLNGCDLQDFPTRNGFFQEGACELIAEKVNLFRQKGNYSEGYKKLRTMLADLYAKSF